jgi:hypothetical protein
LISRLSWRRFYWDKMDHISLYVCFCRHSCRKQAENSAKLCFIVFFFYNRAALLQVLVLGWNPL